MFTRDHTEMLTRTPAGIGQKMRVKTKQGFGGNLGLVQRVKLVRKAPRQRTGNFWDLPILTKSCPSALIKMVLKTLRPDHREYYEKLRNE